MDWAAASAAAARAAARVAVVNPCGHDVERHGRTARSRRRGGRGAAARAAARVAVVNPCGHDEDVTEELLVLDAEEEEGRRRGRRRGWRWTGRR